jgi:murein DD-endopeptidase MepM/ murein hydrolase activator NlpD
VQSEPHLPFTKLSRRDALILAAAGAGALTVGDLLRPIPAAAAIAWYYPFTTGYPVTSYFGEYDVRYWESTNHFHRGADIGAPYGATIRAMAAGAISYGTGSGWGNYARIDHGMDGGHHYYSLYAHHQGAQLASGNVSAGTPIAYVGTSGVEFAHLHIEITVDGTYDVNRRDPFLYIPSAPGANQPVGSAPNDEGRDEYVTVYFAKGAAYDVVQSGWKYLQGPDGILRAFSSLAWQAYLYTHPSVIWAEWDCVDIYNHLVVNYGLYEYEGTTEPGKLTGRIIQGQSRFYPRVWQVA